MNSNKMFYLVYVLWLHEMGKQSIIKKFIETAEINNRTKIKDWLLQKIQ